VSTKNSIQKKFFVREEKWLAQEGGHISLVRGKNAAAAGKKEKYDQAEGRREVLSKTKRRY